MSDGFASEGIATAPRIVRETLQTLLDAIEDQRMELEEEIDVRVCAVTDASAPNFSEEQLLDRLLDRLRVATALIRNIPQ